jgi:2-oxoglutarate ferredoxin oxidoreductase subunit alpha
MGIMEPAVLSASEQPAPEQPAGRRPVVNDFAFVVATPNGTGSQTSNLILLRALFKMGIPVNGKNIFPSNIQGLPTWYHIRVSHEGHIARRETSEVLIAFNEATIARDIQTLPAGGICIYNADWRGTPQRDDITMYGIPVQLFLRNVDAKGRFRDRYSNMIYVGAMAQICGIELEAIDEALMYHFRGRRRIVDPNMDVIRMAYDWCAENLEPQENYRVERIADSRVTNQMLITGNEAAALGALFGGVSLVAWYPITPSTSLVDAVNAHMDLRRDPETGENTCVVIQAEDELSAIGMLIGGGWAGARSMTATSGPGISLMAEFAGLGYFAEVPAVIWDIQRVGPSTGLPTRTSQGDLLFVYFLGHGDTKNVILLPATVAECFEFGTTSFNLAAQLQTPVFVLSDLDLGMNTWMTPPFEYPQEPIVRGKVLSAEDVAQKGFARYKDLDGDGIGYRTLPGNEHPLAAYFARGTGHDELARYSEDPADWFQNMDRLKRKYETARRLAPGPIIEEVENADFGIIAFGTTLPAIEEARDRLANAGIKTDFLRVRALPASEEVRRFIERHERVYVIEMNRDGQLHSILTLDAPELATRLRSIAYLDGMPLTARWVVEAIMEKEQSK